MDILISEEVDAPALKKLGEKYQIVHEGNLWKNAAKLKAALTEARTLLIRNQTQLTADVLAAAPKLIAIGRLGVGLDNIDVEAATKQNVVVVAPLNANAASVAELTLGLILALARKIPFSDRLTKSGEWDRKKCVGMELDKKTIAICGFGRVGRLVAARARAFGLRIIVFDPFIKADSSRLGEVGATLATKLEEALSAADFVTVHAPFTPETRHLFGSKIFSEMKLGAFFLNLSRGGLVDEKALLNALQTGHLGGAALDVREVEPPKRKSAFEEMENVILTPHIGAFTHEAQTRTFEAVCEDIDRLLRGEPAVNFVNIPQPAR
ncbi:MAG: hydroxyacid dehydrogenase [Limisphaerales bacterium]